MVDIRIASENSLIVYLSDTIEPATAVKIAALTQAVRATLGSQLLDLIPSYASLLVIFDPKALSHNECKTQLHNCLAALKNQAPTAGSVIELPVCYDGPDLNAVANATKLSCTQIIQLHSQTEYVCYAVGFAPGFAYLGQLDKRLHLPRLDTPRKLVPAGSVAIAGQQTAVYPVDSPGGWHLIGHCTQTFFDSNKTPPCPVAVGDRVRFVSVTSENAIK